MPDERIPPKAGVRSAERSRASPPVGPCALDDVEVEGDHGLLRPVTEEGRAARASRRSRSSGSAVQGGEEARQFVGVREQESGVGALHDLRVGPTARASTGVPARKALISVPPKVSKPTDGASRLSSAWR